MKAVYLTIASLIIGLTIQAQAIPSLDKSILDISYYPVNYPILKVQNKVNTPPVARVIYSRPLKNGRTVYGELVEFGEVWRLGANEATELEFFTDVSLGGRKISKGRYTMFCIPTPEKWTIMINRDTDSWGAFQYDPEKDIARIDVKPEKQETPVEPFSMSFVEDSSGINLIIAWDDVKAIIPFSYQRSM